MRMRKKKNGAARLAACAEVLLEKPENPISDAKGIIGKDAKIYLEIGAGKGGFARETARRNPDVLYLAMEKVSDCVVLAAERAVATADERCGNLRFLVANADDLLSWFAPDSVDAIFLNFSDPWPKAGYYKRRLTYRKYLETYFLLLKKGGTLSVKTDNENLFAFTKEELAALGIEPDIATDDLHASPYAAENVMTEYESNFVSQGLNIHYLKTHKE